MRHKQTSQSALSAVSHLFLIIGVMAFIETGVSAVRGSFHFNFAIFGVLGVGIFLGLRRYSRAWHVCALVFTSYFIVTLSVAVMVCLFAQSSSALASWLCLPLVLWLLVTLRQYKVLTHPAIRRLFVEKSLALPLIGAAEAPDPTPIHAEASQS